MTNQNYTVYTDGSCSGNPGSGGWAFMILNEDGNIMSSGCGSCPKTTNNRMELLAVINGLNNTPEFSHVVVLCDSQYVSNAFNNRWLDKWQNNNWKTASGSAVKNQDLWKRLLSAYQSRLVEFRWVKGHALNEYNNAVDQSAVSANRQQINSSEDVGYNMYGC